MFCALPNFAWGSVKSMYVCMYVSLYEVIYLSLYEVIYLSIYISHYRLINMKTHSYTNCIFYVITVWMQFFFLKNCDSSNIFICTSIHPHTLSHCRRSHHTLHYPPVGHIRASVWVWMCPHSCFIHLSVLRENHVACPM